MRWRVENWLLGKNDDCEGFFLAICKYSSHLTKPSRDQQRDEDLDHSIVVVAEAKCHLLNGFRSLDADAPGQAPEFDSRASIVGGYLPPLIVWILSPGKVIRPSNELRLQMWFSGCWELCIAKS